MLSNSPAVYYSIDPIYRNFSIFNIQPVSVASMIPPSLYNLFDIRDFDLGKNQLIMLSQSLAVYYSIDPIYRNFSSSISNLSQLQVFDIGVNSFRGPIPLTLGIGLNKL
ncbi:hypothetical protein HN873_044188 [Arachis hypogaea]